MKCQLVLAEIQAQDLGNTSDCSVQSHLFWQTCDILHGDWTVWKDKHYVSAQQVSI
jgi:hypothetical protein